MRIQQRRSRGRIVSGLLWVGLLAAVGAGCGGRTISGINNNADRPDGWVGPDGWVNRDGWVRPDGQVPADAGPVCHEEDWWELLQVPIVEIQVLTPMLGQQGMSEGVSIRVKAVVEVGGCDELAGVQYYMEPNTSRIMLDAYMWQYRGNQPCPEFLARMPEVFAFKDLGPGQWTVMDGYPSPNDPVVANFRVRSCQQGEDCYCTLWDGIPGSTGDSCTYNCMCEYPLDCVYEGQLDPNWGGACYQTCSTDADCPVPFVCMFGVLDMPEGICDQYGEGCGPNNPCPAGFDCEYVPDQEVDWCLPAMNPDQTGMQCQDDCDCPAGFSCASLDQPGPNTCQIKCRGNLDCPEVMCCDMGYWEWGQNRLFCQWCWEY